MKTRMFVETITGDIPCDHAGYELSPHHRALYVPEPYQAGEFNHPTESDDMLRGRELPNLPWATRQGWGWRR